MPVINQPKVTCDECGIEKKESNHWYMVVDNGSDGVEIKPFTLTYAAIYATAKIYCGSGHLLKYLSQRIK